MFAIELTPAKESWKPKSKPVANTTTKRGACLRMFYRIVCLKILRLAVPQGPCTQIVVRIKVHWRQCTYYLEHRPLGLYSSLYDSPSSVEVFQLVRIGHRPTLRAELSKEIGAKCFGFRTVHLTVLDRRMYTYVYIYMYMCGYICLYVYILHYICLSTYLSNYLSVRLSIYLPIYQSTQDASAFCCVVIILHAHTCVCDYNTIRASAINPRVRTCRVETRESPQQAE